MSSAERPSTPPVGGVCFGDLRRLTPVSRHFGFNRGRPVDRYYIEAFLARHANDVRGCVLEIGDDAYTRRFGGARVVRSDVLHVRRDSPHATIIADLTAAGHVPDGSFDCVILTQTLQFIYDVRTALHTLHRILQPAGVALVTVPGITQLDRGEWGSSWYWAFTPVSLRRLLEEQFSPQEIQIEGHGNVLAACAFLQGLAAEELEPSELDFHDPCYPVAIAARVHKPA